VRSREEQALVSVGAPTYEVGRLAGVPANLDDEALPFVFPDMAGLHDQGVTYHCLHMAPPGISGLPPMLPRHTPSAEGLHAMDQAKASNRGDGTGKSDQGFCTTDGHELLYAIDRRIDVRCGCRNLCTGRGVAVEVAFCHPYASDVDRPSRHWRLRSEYELSRA